MINGGRRALQQDDVAHTSLIPAVAMFLTVLVGELPGRPLPGRLRRAGGEPVNPRDVDDDLEEEEGLSRREMRITRRERIERAARAARLEALPPEYEGTLLEVEDLRTSFRTPRGTVRAVDGVSLTVDARDRARHRRRVGVGQDRAGSLDHGTADRRATWSAAARSATRGRELIGAPPAELRRLWGTEMAMVFQDPMTSLNPVMRIGRQITEGMRYHLGLSKEAAQVVAVKLLSDVGIPDPERAAAPVPARAVGGHAAAGHDRHRAGHRAEAAAGRRAHHGARRHRAGPDPRPAPARSSASATWRWSSSPTTSAWWPAAPTRSS